MDTPRIVELRVKGMRTLDDVTIRFGTTGLTVLIGESGAGKSTVIEALALLRLVGEGAFWGQLSARHGGMPALLRAGSNEMTLGVTIDVASKCWSYDMAIVRQGLYASVTSEQLRELPGPGSSGQADGKLLLDRRMAKVSLYLDGERVSDADEVDPLLPRLAASRSSGPLALMVEALRSADLQLPFLLSPRWAGGGAGMAPMRESRVVERAVALDRFGGNLANCYLALKNGPKREWDETLELVRLGLGMDVDDIVLQVDPGGGQAALAIRFGERDGSVVPAFSMSDGMLSYLAFVALCRLPTPRSILAFDEPDLHLHPHLLSRVVDLLGRVGERCPVLLATHSDRLLDLLPDPVASTVVLELDADRKTRVLRPDRPRYERWKREFSGIGQLRDAGFLPTVLEASPPEPVS